MRIVMNFRLLIAAGVLIVLALAPGASATTTAKSCPKEPGSATIASGQTYIGTNCVLNSVSDQDLFTFSATKGDTWAIVAESTNVVYPNQMCFSLFDPQGNGVVKACTQSGVGAFFAAATVPLTVTGTYTIDLSEVQTAGVNYGISVERISPAPADATALTLGNTVSGLVSQPSAQEAYSFYGTTTGTYQVTATMTSGVYPQNLCFAVYQPTGAGVVAACTLSGVGQTTIQANVTPAVTGNSVIVLYTQENDDTMSFNLNLTCVSAPGTCGSPPPVCSLKDALSYNGTTGTLTMNFTLATPVAATWNAWLSSQNTMTSMFSVSQPITEPAITVTKTAAVAKAGKVGVLSTLTTPTQGITCSNFTIINTGTP